MNKIKNCQFLSLRAEGVAISGFIKFEGIVLLLVILLSLIGTITIYRSCNHIINPPKSAVIAQSPWRPKQSQTRLPVTNSHKLFSKQGSQLQITIPPGKDSTKLTITEDLHVIARDSISKQSPISIIKRTSIIRYHPTLHIGFLMPISSLDSIRVNSCSFVVKVRVLEIWRFGTCAYLTTTGFGPGIDFKLISNISLDYAQLFSFQSLTFKPYLGMSLKL